MTSGTSNGDASETMYIVARAVSALVILLGGLVLSLGWGLGIEGVVRLGPGRPAMVPETAAALMVAGIGCFALTTAHRTLATALSLLGLAIILGAYFLRPRIVTSVPLEDAMSAATATCILMAAVTIAAGRAPTRPVMAVAIFSNLTGLALSLTVLEVKLFGATLLGNTYGIGTMALHSALGFLALNVAFVFASAENQMLRWVFSDQAQARLLRRIALVTVAIIGVIFIGLVHAFQADLITESLPLLQAAMFLTATGAFLTAGFFIEDEVIEGELQAALDRAEARVSHQRELAAEQDENLRVLGQIVGGVAHNFNNTLASIQGNLELISIDPDNKGHYSEEAGAAVARAAELTNQLLAVGRKARAEEPVENAPLIVSEFTQYFERALPKAIRVRQEIDQSEFRGLKIDAMALERCLMNLLINAREAIEGDGEIKVRLSEQRIDNRFAASFAFQSGLAPGHYALLEVSDTGCGMERDVLRKATQPYFTTKGLAKASGLGLASIHGISQQHGGGVLIASAPGKGTRVVVALPIFQEEAPTSAASPAAGTAAPDMIILAAKEASQARLSRAATQKGLSTRVVRTVDALFAQLQNGALPSFVLIGDKVVDGQRSAAIAADVEARHPGIRASYVGQGPDRFVQSREERQRPVAA
ncbi:MAG: ATP-binding protein [Pseudomonadota bacterium]